MTQAAHVSLSPVLTSAAALCVILAVLPAGTHAHESTAELLMTQSLYGMPDAEGMMLTVEYPPGESSPVHRHNADTFVYVLEGSVVMQVEGGEPVTLGVGQTFYETPADVHLVSRNASKTESARILVFFVKKPDALATEPVP